MRTKDTLDLLSGMADEWNNRTARLLDMALAVMMVRQGVAHVTITPEEAASVLRHYRIEREVISDQWSVHLVPRAEPMSTETADADV